MIIGVKVVSGVNGGRQSRELRQNDSNLSGSTSPKHTSYRRLDTSSHATYTMAEANVPETPVTVVRPGKTMSEALLNEKVRLWAW